MRALVHRALTHRHRTAGLVALAIVTALPALWAGWLGDDWAHRAVMGGHPPFVDVDPIWYLFRFLGPGEVNTNLASAGVLTWWVDMDVRAAFFRPLSALTHVLDHTLWPDQPVLQHAHSLLWGALMTWCALRFVAEEGTSPLAVGLAGLFFALEDAHAVPLTWLANRNALVTTTLSIVSVHAFVRWRKTGAWSAWVASLGALALGLAAGEAAIGACAWMGAHMLTREPMRRWGALLGPAATVVAWRLAYDALGYGADHSGLYIDPGATPGVWLQALVTRWPVLAAGQLLSLPIDGWGVLHTPARIAMTIGGLGVTLAFGALAWPTLRARPVARTAALTFVLVLVPFTSTFPMDRLYTFASLASAVLIAEMADFHGVLSIDTGAVRGRVFAGWAVLGLVAWHGPLSGLARPVRCAGTPLMGLIFDVGADTAPDDPALEEQDLIFVHATEFATMYTYVKRSVPPHAQGRPVGVALLSSFWTDVHVTREDAHTLLLTPEEGFLSRPIDRLVRDPARAPFTADTHLSHHAMDVHVRTVTTDGRPAEVAFRFADPLEDETHRRFVVLGMSGVETWTPPPVGSTTTLPGLF